MSYGEVLSGASWDVTSTESRYLYGDLMTTQNTCYKVPFWYISQGMAQLEPGEHVDFVFTFTHRAPRPVPRIVLLGFYNYRSGFLHPPKMKAICQNGNLENYTYTCEIRQILTKWVFQPMHRIHNNALFCVRNCFSGCAENMCAGLYRLRENIHHYLLCQTQKEGQTVSIPGAGDHTYWWKMEQISVVALTLTVLFKVVVLGRVVLWATNVG